MHEPPTRRGVWGLHLRPRLPAAGSGCPRALSTQHRPGTVLGTSRTATLRRKPRPRENPASVQGGLAGREGNQDPDSWQTLSPKSMSFTRHPTCVCCVRVCRLPVLSDKSAVLVRTGAGVTKLTEHRDIIPKQTGLSAEAVSSASADIPEGARRPLQRRALEGAV